MGIHDLLAHLPGGKEEHYFFYKLNEKLGEEPAIVIDAGGPLWQFAAAHAWDYLRDNHNPSLIEWARFLSNLRSICRWKIEVYMDGRVNKEKAPEIARRADKAQAAIARNDLQGQVKNTPAYINKANAVCKHMKISSKVAPYEADPQVCYAANIDDGKVIMTGDSDMLAYGLPDDVGKVIIVKSFRSQTYRLIDINADVVAGQYPLIDLYRKHGKIVFQLYAGCSGCDFTTESSGIRGIGYTTFISLASGIDGELSANSLARKIWNEKNDIVTADGFSCVQDVEQHLQHIVNVYCRGRVYNDNGNLVDIRGRYFEKANVHNKFKQHMMGNLDVETLSELPVDLYDDIYWSDLLMQTTASASTIRGVNLPDGKAPSQCTVSVLRDAVSARGGKISGIDKEGMVKLVKAYQLVEEEVQKDYVDRHPDPNSSYYDKTSTSTTKSISQILSDLEQSPKFNSPSDSNIKNLIVETHQLFRDGMFEDKYDNISKVAPELEPALIYTTCGNIGQDIEEKNIGDALARCFYQMNPSYHAIALMPGEDSTSGRAIILSKALASMRTDEKTRNATDDGEPPKKQEYLVMIELFYQETEAMEHNHDLGIFLRLGQTYCAQCVAGHTICRHIPERLWYQYHHWTPERFGIDRPSTIDACAWAPGGRKLTAGATHHLDEQQCVKLEHTIKGQEEKAGRGVERDCTEGIKFDYEPHMCTTKRRKKHDGHFTAARCEQLFRLLREQSTD